VQSENITELLVEWGGGDRAALDKLMPLVYSELRRLARNYLRRERRNHTLEPTGLVHEAYLKLVEQQSITWKNRAQFFALAAKMMRNILVDHARSRKAEKRGGERYLISLSKADRFAKKPDVDLIALDDALCDLETIKPQHSRIVELRFFGGLTIEETAEVIGMSHATVEREWSFARSWLRREVGRREDAQAF
jgi:RNA polymerase sigma factor (TIGR02999 family)